MNRHLRDFLRKAPAIVAMAAVAAGPANAGLLISQYVETNSGDNPKGIEIWNPTANPIDFYATNLDVRKGTNGQTPKTDFTLTTFSSVSASMRQHDEATLPKKRIDF